MTSPRPRFEASAETQARLRAIYERAHASFVENLATIEKAIGQLATGVLDAPGRKAAERAAHRLVGAAGTVGFPAATEPARRLEDAFTDDARPDDAPLLQVDADALRGILFGLDSAPRRADALGKGDGRFRDDGAGHSASVATYTVNPAAVEHARALIEARQYVLDSDWGDVQPRADAQNGYLERHSWDEYAAWHLGLTEGASNETKSRYAFVYGDLRRLHRTGLIACVYRASEWRHKEIELAAHDLLQQLDAKTLGS